MKLTVVFVLLVCSLVSRAEVSQETIKPYNYLENEVANAESAYRFNQYETIISGAMAFLVGNVGFYTTSSETLRLAYSAVQTVGIITVGQGIYDYYSPDQDRDMLKLLKQKKLTRSHMADGFISMLGQEERAKRLALLSGSGLLVVQYLANAYLSDVPRDIRDLYLFMGGVNVIIAGHSYFSRGKYERYLDYKSKVSWSPFLGQDKAGLAVSLSF